MFEETKILKLIRGLLCLTVFVVPIFVVPIGAYYHVSSKTFLFSFLVQIMLLVYLWLIYLYPKYRPQNHLLSITLALSMLAGLVSSIFGEYLMNSVMSNMVRMDGLFLLLHTFIFFVIVSSVIQTKKELKEVLWYSILSAVFVTISVIISPEVFSFLGSYLSPLGGVTGNNSFAGVYILFNIFFSAYLFFDSNLKKEKAMLFAIFCVFCLSPIFINYDILVTKISLGEIMSDPTVFLGSARAVTLSGIFGSLIGAVLYLVQMKKGWSSKLFKIILFGLVSLGVAGSLSLFMPDSLVRNKLMNATGGYREVYWQQAYLGFEDHPWLGWGEDNFRLANSKHFDPQVFSGKFYGFETVSSKPHNVIYEKMNNIGFLGLSFYLLIFASFFYVLLKSQNISKLEKSLFVGLASAYFLQNLVFFDVLLSRMMFMLLLASVIVLDNGPAKTTAKIFEHKKRYPIVFSVILFGGLVFLYLFSYLPIVRHYSFFAYCNASPVERLEEYNRPSNYQYIYNNVFDLELCSIQVESFYVDNMEGIKKEDLSLAPYAKDIDLLIQKFILARDKPDFEQARGIYRLLNVRYQIYGDEYSRENMKKYSKLMMETSPGHPLGYVYYAKLLPPEEGLRVLEIIYPKISSNYEINYEMIEMAKKLGDEDVLLSKIKAAKENLSN